MNSGVSADPAARNSLQLAARSFNRSIFCTVIALLLTCLISSGARAGQKEDLSNKTFYTIANIWFENEQDIPSLNYHKGTMLPVGTKVKKVEISDGNVKYRFYKFPQVSYSSSILAQSKDEEAGTDSISFTDEQGHQYRINFLAKYAAPNSTIREYFNQYFSEEDPFREGGPFQKMTDLEKRNIKLGEVAIDMSKEAVLMAFGYPPGHKTPSLRSDIWIYWISRRSKQQVMFIDNKVAKIK